MAKKLKKIKVDFKSDIFLAKKEKKELWLAENKKINNFSEIQNYHQQLKQVLKNNPIVNHLISCLFHCKNLSEFFQGSLKAFLNVIHNARFSIYLKAHQSNEFTLFSTFNNNENLYKKIPLPKEIITAFKSKKNLNKGFPLLVIKKSWTTIYFPLFSTELKGIMVIDYQEKSDFLYKEEILYKLLFLFKEIFLHFYQNKVTLIDNFFFTFDYYQKLNIVIENHLVEYMDKQHYSFFSIQIAPKANLSNSLLKKFNDNFILFLKNNFFNSQPIVYLGEKPMAYRLLFFSWVSEKDVMMVVDKFFITPNFSDANFFHFLIKKKN